MSGIDVDRLPPHLRCEVAGHSGGAGHVLLTYPSGGMLLASAGHWAELSHIDVSEERLLYVAASSYGQAYADNVQRELNSLGTPEERRAYSQTLATTYVQQ